MTKTLHSSIKLLPHESLGDRKIILVSWLSHDERSALLGKHVGADVYFIKWGKRAWYMTPLRYIVQTIITWQVLQQEKPDVVIIQIPPIFSVPVVYLHKLFYGTQYVLDTHSGSFLSRIGRLTQGMHRFFSKEALTTLVPNTDIENKIKQWDAPVQLLGYTPDDYPVGKPFAFERDDVLNIVFICTFAVDEPVEAVIEAASLSPKAHIYITGDYKRAKHLLSNKPDNVTFTGYTEYEVFIGLLRNCDVIMDLTIWENTVLMGAYEAISLHKPLITSNSQVLRDYFPIGTIHIENTPESIAQAIDDVQINMERLQEEIEVLHENLLKEWEENFDSFKKVLDIK
ncbi:MAG: glycosyltransferase [Chloroflexota bacterium]